MSCLWLIFIPLKMLSMLKTAVPVQQDYNVKILQLLNKYFVFFKQWLWVCSSC